MKSVYGGMILGSSVFIKDTLEYVESERLNNEGISHLKVLQSPYGFDDSLVMVCERYGVKPGGF